MKIDYVKFIVANNFFGGSAQRNGEELKTRKLMTVDNLLDYDDGCANPKRDFYDNPKHDFYE